MTKIEELQSQTEEFLTQQTPTAVAFAAAPTETPPRQGFDFFSADQMERAFNLTDRFMALANSIGGEAGLEAVIAEARKATTIEPLELVKFSLMVFIVHHPQGSRLPIPPLEKRAPEKLPLLMRQIVALPTTVSTDPEAQLDWYREDPLANSHHEHWHIVYPWRGVSDGTGTGKRKIQDRQGELFFYMHQQMLARYDTERIAVGLPRVKPMSNYTEKLMEGYTFDLPGFDPRPSGLQLVDVDHKDYKNTVHELELRRDRLLNAVDIGRFETIEGSTIPVNIDLIGATIESTIGSVSERSITSFYGNHHGSGHRLLSYINNSDGKKLDPNGELLVGVMADPAVSICDPIFYRWHKHIDDIFFRWQEFQQPQDFSDAPKVLIRNGLNGTPPESQSPDIILSFVESIPGSHEANFDGQAYGEKTFGGENWDKNFSTGEVTTSELHTMMLKREVKWRDKEFPIDYLDHREFCYFLRIENLKNEQKEVTVRIFLVAKDFAEDRRMWIEMDKFRHTLQPSQRSVIYRPAALSSVIQKPAEKPPKPISKPGNEDEGEKNYCNCGWPYNLLLPRSTQEGIDFRLMVILTDWENDKVSLDAKCGSMSFCGAKDSYPDRRPMGYPFDRQFPDQSITSAIAAPYNLNMAARDITIKWVDAQTIHTTSNISKEKTMTSTENNSLPSFTGTWTYRSFNNDSDPNNDATWFIAEMELEHLPSGELRGKLKGGDPKYVYELTGYVDENCTTEKNPSSWWDQRLIIVLKANGATPETNGHEYEYRGYYPEFWPNGKDQVPTFVGSVIRAKRPDDTSLEGKVGSFIAIKKS